MVSTIISGYGSSNKVAGILEAHGVRKFLLVCGQSFPKLSIHKTLTSIPTPSVIFSDFSTNPKYEQVASGVKVFNAYSCDAIVAVGGGSALDVAKCIKLFSQLNHNVNYLQQRYQDSEVLLIAVPTTAGSGSESTKYAVIYFGDEKQSVTHESILPDYAILDPSVLITLPLYQKKCAMLDALCQGIESWWSVHANRKSKAYAKNAVRLIMLNWNAYIENYGDTAGERIMMAANDAGHAINISQTTAAHAMSYKITSMYGLPHGHAVAICLPPVWRYMLQNMGACVDKRGGEYLLRVFEEISLAMGCSGALDAIRRFERLLRELDIVNPRMQSSDDVDMLVASVNPIRLQNNPVVLSEDALRSIYKSIISNMDVSHES